MGSFFTKSKRPRSRVTDGDISLLQLKQQRDKLQQYQKRIELQLEKDRELARKCLQMGRKERALLLLRKKKYQENLLSNTDKQLDNLQRLAADLEFTYIEKEVLDGLKVGNEALKKVHALLNIDEIEKIMDETREGIEKQEEIDALLSENLTRQDEDDILKELDELVTKDETVTLPEVPLDELPVAEEIEDKPAKQIKEKRAAVTIEA
ncbi:charged multivesicular body protein 6-A [Teleopsis dalmanni]|uniref:charged multivesicular body protein 6-A n=1 Tax=Teleopsis dalmanni TaxID=139649 RepID=UPI000D329E92|nr:charged multivesicular body protein 6-A [Teleopsis dalmanni]